MRQRKLTQKALVAPSLLDWIQVGALKVLDEGHHQQGPIFVVTDDCWYLAPAQVGDGSQPSLTRDQLEELPCLPHDDRLQQSTRANGVSELLEFGYIEFTAGLKGIRPDLGNGDSLELAGARRG